MLRALEVIQVSLQLLVDVHETGRRVDAFPYTEAHTMSLPVAMVRILTKDDHLHLQ
jgi:hypothetical protein